MDLLIVKLPHCHALRVGSGSGAEWKSSADLVAVFPRAGWCAGEVLSALSHNANLTIQAPLSCVLARVAQLISTHGHGGETSELVEPPTEYDHLLMLPTRTRGLAAACSAPCGPECTEADRGGPRPTYTSA
jgi:hypothetical protein